MLGNPECEAKPDPGVCKAYVPSYYYDPATKDCRFFVYGGNNCQIYNTL